MTKLGAHDHANLDVMEAELKKKVTTWLNRNNEIKPGDSLTSVIIYLLFAFCYLFFLSSNVEVVSSFQSNLDSI
jgi:hypothetical protein